ncbi:MAG: flagellar hook-length control protein FliK [Succinivibrionaceae bacterium]
MVGIDALILNDSCILNLSSTSLKSDDGDEFQNVLNSFNQETVGLDNFDIEGEILPGCQNDGDDKVVLLPSNNTSFVTDEKEVVQNIENDSVDELFFNIEVNTSFDNLLPPSTTVIVEVEDSEANESINQVLENNPLKVRNLVEISDNNITELNSSMINDTMNDNYQELPKGTIQQNKDLYLDNLQLNEQSSDHQKVIVSQVNKTNFKEVDLKNKDSKNLKLESGVNSDTSNVDVTLKSNSVKVFEKKDIEDLSSFNDHSKIDTKEIKGVNDIKTLKESREVGVKGVSTPNANHVYNSEKLSSSINSIISSQKINIDVSVVEDEVSSIKITDYNLVKSSNITNTKIINENDSVKQTFLFNDDSLNQINIQLNNQSKAITESKSTVINSEHIIGAVTNKTDKNIRNDKDLDNEKFEELSFDGFSDSELKANNVLKQTISNKGKIVLLKDYVATEYSNGVAHDISSERSLHALTSNLDRASINSSSLANTTSGSLLNSIFGGNTLTLDQRDPKQTAENVAEKIMQMAARNLKEIELELNPRYLGKMKIKIDISDSNNASVSFAVSNVATKELLQNSESRLRESLSSVGIELTEQQVNDNYQEESEEKKQSQEQWKEEVENAIIANRRNADWQSFVNVELGLEELISAKP